MNITKLPITIREIDKNFFYTLDYVEDYKLEKFMNVGAKSKEELVDFIGSEVYGGFPLNELMLRDLGCCSTYAAQIKNGDYIFGRNFDFDPCARMLVRTCPKDGYASLSMVDLNFSGINLEQLPLTDEQTPLILSTPYVVLDGVNEKGLAVAVLIVRYQTTEQKTGKINFTTTTSLRMALDRCATVEEAVQLYQSYDMYSAEGANYHFHIADAQGNSVVIEYIGNIMHVIENKYCTNFLLTPNMGKFGSGHDRYDKLEKVMNEKKGIFNDMAEAMKPLCDVSEDRTRWSAVYNLTNPSIMLVNERNYDNPYIFTLDSFYESM